MSSEINALPSASTLPQKSDSAPNSYLRSLLPRLMGGEDLTRTEAARLLEGLLDDQTTDAQIAATLVALSLKGETVEELTGLAEAMRARAARINSAHPHFIDMAGTGSSPAKTFNVSTAAAFVISGAGLPVAKHGNRAVTSQTGSADVLNALGVNVAAAPEVSEKCFNDLGICFMFAPLYHGSTARVASVRRELGIRTAFNLLGPLTNPAGAPHQVIGVWKAELTESVACALAALGTERAWVVHGLDGLDEISLAAKTRVSEAYQGRVKTFEIEPDDFGIGRCSLERLKGHNAETSARTIHAVLEGKRRDEARAIIIINAAAALLVGGMACDLREAMSMAQESVESGAALAKLEGLMRMTNE